MNLTIPNHNNKLSADCFLHVFKSLGKYTAEELMEAKAIQINELPDTYSLHESGIGISSIADLPTWMFYASHKCTKKEYMHSVKGTPTTQIYFMLFKKNII
jgi:hypothetical protein